MNQVRRFLIPFPAAGEEEHFSPDDTVCSRPCAEKLFEPARLKFRLPRTVSLQLCVAGMVAAFLSGASMAQWGPRAEAPVAASQNLPRLRVPTDASPSPAAAILPAAARPATHQPRRIRFTLDESRKFQKVGHLQLRLKKADARRQIFTLALQMDNQHLELRDRNVAEPIRLQTANGRQNEILVHRINSDHVEGSILLSGR